MSYYPELVAAAFGGLSSEPTGKILALTCTAAASVYEKLRAAGQSAFLAATLPSGTDLRYLSNGEQFLEEAFSLAAHSSAKCIFICPPFLGDLRLSNSWKQKHGPLGLMEAIANEFLTGPDAELRLRLPALETLVMLVPTHFVSSLRSSRWRQEFFPAHGVVVIEHEHANVPSEFGMPIHCAVRFCTVIFQRRAAPIRFFKITEAALSDGSESLATDLRRLLRQPAGKTRCGYVHQGLLDEGYPCSFDYYSEETERLRQEIGVLGERVPLSSAADVLMGFTPRHPERDSGQGETEFLFINARDITRDGRVDLSDVRTQVRPSQVRHYLADGDFCIRQIYQADGGFIVGVYEGDGRPISFNNTVIVVRPHASLNPAQRQVLLNFLRSPLAHRLGNAKQSLSSIGGHYRVTPSVLREFPVPLADEELVSTIQQLNEAKAAFNQWIKHIDEESNAILMEATATGSRRRLLHAGQLARQRHRAGEQVEELDYRIRTQFPHPLAYVWRQLQVAGPDRYHRLRAVTKAAEGHTCFLALVAVLMSRAAGQPIKYLAEIAKRLSQRKSGTNFGDWFAILKEANESRSLRALKGAMPFAEVSQLCDGEIWEPAAKHLMALRNDDSHGRIAPASVSASLLAEAEKALETIYRATEFLTEYQLMFITDTRFDSIRQTNWYQYRDLTGDNALAQLRHDEARRSDLESGSLYLRDRQRHLHLFRPLLQYLECPECHQMATFFLDTYDGESGGSLVGLKSFERNSVRTEPTADAFIHVGLLKSQV